MKDQIKSCISGIDYLWISIKSNEPSLIDEKLSKRLSKVRSLPEVKTTNPIMPCKFKKRTAYKLNNREVFLIHQKMRPLKLDAILIIHDPTPTEIIEIERILFNLSNLKGFHINRIEFRFDSTPVEGIDIVNFQLALNRQFHHKGARCSFYKGSLPRATFYTNNRKHQFQTKNYIRPKDHNTSGRPFLRFELTTKTEWIQRNLNIHKPSDLLDLNINALLQYIAWVKLDMDAVRRFSARVSPEDIWADRIKIEHEYLGPTYVINRYRELNFLNSANPHRIKDQFYKRSHLHEEMVKMFKQSYFNWTNS